MFSLLLIVISVCATGYFLGAIYLYLCIQESKLFQFNFYSNFGIKLLLGFALAPLLYAMVQTSDATVGSIMDSYVGMSGPNFYHFSELWFTCLPSVESEVELICSTLKRFC